MIYVYIGAGTFYIIAAICLGLFTLNNVNNVNNMPYYIFGLKNENYEVIDKRKLNKIMVIQNTLACILFLLAGVLTIIFRESTVFTLLLCLYNLSVFIIFPKVAKKYINIK